MGLDYNKIKRNRLKNVQGQESANQMEHIVTAGAKLIMGGVLVPGDVITSDPSSAPILVGAGNILRLEFSGTAYIAFGKDPSTAPTNAAITSSTTPALKLVAGTYLVVATDDFFASSANPTRIELLQFDNKL